MAVYTYNPRARREEVETRVPGALQPVSPMKSARTRFSDEPYLKREFRETNIGLHRVIPGQGDPPTCAHTAHTHTK